MATAGKSPEWLIQHLGISTGSSIADQIGWSPYADPIMAWALVTKGAHKEFDRAAKEFLKWGDENEPNNVKTFERTWDLQVAESPFVYDQDFRWIRVTPDGYIKDDPIDGTPAVVEAKCPAKLPDHPPAVYLPQVYAEMKTYGVYKNYFTAWGPHTLKVWLILWDDAVWNYIMLMLYRFRECCKAGIPPSEHIIPHIGTQLFQWEKTGYDPKAKAKIPKNEFFPVRPKYRLVFKAKGNFEPIKHIFQIDEILFSLQDALRDIVDGKNVKLGGFERFYKEIISKDVEKLDLSKYQR